MNKFVAILMFVIVILALATTQPPPAMVTGPSGSMLEIGMSVSGTVITGAYSFIPYPTSPLTITNRYPITVPDYDTATCYMEVTRVHHGDITIGRYDGVPTIKPGVNEQNQLKCVVPVNYGKFDMTVIFMLEKTIVPPTPVCGNGKIETGEECDDGNVINGDGCSSTCSIETVTPPAPPTPADPFGAILKGILSVFQSIINFIGSWFT